MTGKMSFFVSIHLFSDFISKNKKLSLKLFD
jgi:hypothetical protein